MDALDDHPPFDQEERLCDVLAAYLEAIDAGWAPTRAELVARYPDLADELHHFFGRQERIARLADPSRATPHAGSTPRPNGDGSRDTDPQTVVMSRPGEVAAEEGYWSLDDYDIVQEIKRGGMGIVFKATQKSLHRTVALKMLLAGPGISTEEIRRFKNEAAEAANLDHPNIVPIYEVGETDGRPYFSMKLFEGGSLAEQVEALSKDHRRAAQLVARVARAVHHAHQRGLLHRDLKPGNILLDGQGEPHVSDFGLAKRFQAGAAETLEPVSEESRPAESVPPAPASDAPTLPQFRGQGLTRAGVIVGTPDYMAPEQAAGQKALTTAVDVYGLGAILYKLLTRTAPFHGASAKETLRLVREQEPAPPRAHDRQINRRLEAVCLKCLAKDPARRYGTAEAVAEDLERWLRGEAPLAWQAPWYVRGWRVVRRNLVPGAVMAAIGFLAGVLLLISHYADLDRPLREAEEQLARGKEVTLVRDTGLPAWYRWSLGEDFAVVASKPDAPLAILSLAGGMMKLLSSPKNDHFRFSAEVRHDRSVGSSRAGFFFGLNTIETANGVATCWCEVSFSDRCSKEQLYLGPEKGVPRYSKVELTLQRFEAPSGPLSTIPTSEQAYFLPSMHREAAPWRQIAVEVTGKSVRLFWEGNPVSPNGIDVAKLTGDMNRLLAVAKGAPHIQYTFTPQGPLGLVAANGQASFRNVKVTPLTEAAH
jgi:serine/threonine-protein kinase